MAISVLPEAVGPTITINLFIPGSKKIQNSKFKIQNKFKNTNTKVCK
jgi:hypothetical protein